MALLAAVLYGCGASAAETEHRGIEVRVLPVGGVPTFTVDGQPFLVPCFETYVPEEQYFRQFARSGVRMFSFNANAAACDYGHSQPVWVAPDQWDYTGFDQRLERVLAARPDALVLPRINLGTPRWWLDAHPEEMELLGHGSPLYQQPNRNPTLPPDRPFPSLASPRWRTDMGEALRRFLRYVDSSPYGPHIAGYILAGLDTEEWYPWSSGSDQLSGYSEPTRRAFGQWLQRKYGTVEALRQAWGQPDLTFETVPVPSPAERRDEARGTFRDPASQMNVIDFYLFYNDLVPETIGHFAAIAREETGMRKAIGAFYGYMYEFGGDPEYGHNALAAFNRSPHLDFIFVTASYSGRASGSGGDYARGPALSVQLHGKLWYHDNDVVSFLAPSVMARAGMTSDAEWHRNLEHHLAVLGYTDTPLGTRWMYRRSMGFALCLGAYESYFDLHGGYYDHPELMDEVAVLNRLADSAAGLDRSSSSQILIVSDEPSCSYVTFRNQLLSSTLMNTQQQLIKVGAAADHVLLSDLDRLDPTPYRLVVFLNTYHMAGAQRQWVRDRLMRDGRHLLWCYAPGCFEDTTYSLAATARLTGIPIRAPRDPAPMPLRIHVTDPRTGMPGEVVDTGAGSGTPFTVDPTEQGAGLEVWGRCPDTDQPVFVRRQMENWVSWYTVTSVLPPKLYRFLALEAGVHVFNQRDDTLYANRSFLTVHANGNGPRTLRFPGPATVADAISGESLLQGGREVEISLQHGETRILRWAVSESSAGVVGTAVTPHCIAAAMQYRRARDPELGARVQVFVRGQVSAPRFDGRRPSELLASGDWAWHDLDATAGAADIPPQALRVWSFNGRTARWGAGRSFRLEAAGMAPAEVRIEAPPAYVSAATFLAGPDSLHADTIVLHLANDSEAELTIRSLRLWLPRSAATWPTLLPEPALAAPTVIRPGERGFLTVRRPGLPRTYAALEVDTSAGSIWCHLRIKPEAFDIGGGWIGDSLSHEPYLRLLRSLHVNTGNIEHVPGYTDNPELAAKYPLKAFNRLWPLDVYDTDQWLPRIHAVEFLGEPQFGGGRPVPPQAVFDALLPYRVSRLATSVTHSDERTWRWYAGLSDYPHFDAYRVVAPAADAWRQYDRWRGRRIRWGAPLETIGDLARSLRELNRPVPCAAWSQGPHDGWQGWRDGRSRRSPTPAELRAQALHALSTRITSLYWFNLSLGSLLKYPDTWDAIRRVGREIRMLEPYFLEGDAYSFERRGQADGTGDWDLSTVAAPAAAVLFALDTAYEADANTSVFTFGSPRQAAFHFRLPPWLRPPADVFRVDAEGIHETLWRPENGGILVEDRQSRDALYVAAATLHERAAVESRRQAALTLEQAHRPDPDALSAIGSP
jgi:hypothetical protein